jgi:serine phosphatase RsbU (regulator of sigma subunit)
VAALVLAWPEPHTMTDLERELLDELIDGAAPAFERARRTELDREVADTLQNWLLPPNVPDIEHLQISTLYRPGTGELAVGGDWYDVVRLDDDTAAIVVGDVVGHDVRAAAEMGQVRHVLASQLLATADVGAALTLTDRYFFGREIDTMATALVMIFDARAGCLQLSSAGHLPPIVREAGSGSRLIDCGLGPPIGSGLGGYVAVRQPLPPTSLLVAFTDGVIEQRDRPIDDSLEALCRDIDERLDGLGDWPSSPRSGRRVMQILRDRAEEPWRRDDIAAVVVRHVAQERSS